MRRRCDPAVLAIALCAGAAGARAQTDDVELGELSLEQLMEVEVETATREPRRVREAPAIITVITRDDIRAWGFQSVAEALSLVPGVYCIDDYLTADCGVRGVTGGQRGYSKVLKVMIDGHPVTFRADSTSFLGPEMIPIELVDRIEVVRGPVSALYGANAFFGAVNVITRASAGETTLGGRIRFSDQPGVSLAGVYVDGGSWWSATVGAAGVYLDEDGRDIPRSSPDFATLDAAGNLTSRDAIRRPLSAFGRVELRRGALEVDALARYSELDAVAEFLDFGRLTHENRVALRSVDAGVQARYTVSSRLIATARIAASDGRPSGDERLSTGAMDTFPRRRFGSRALEAALEGRVRLFGDDWLTIGADAMRDREELIEVYSVDRATGVETRTSDPAGDEMFTNAGVYAQAIVHPIEAVGLVGNLRYDRHNIYGAATHYRAGAVLTPSAELAFKLLAGTSFKAPAALQLFAQPLFPGEVIGNPELRPENARVIEAEVLWRPLAELSLAASIFVSDVRDKVALVPVDVNLRPINVARLDGRGGEAEARWNRGRHRASAALAFQDTVEVRTDPFLGQIETPTERYPALTEQLRWRYRHPTWGAPAVALRYASQRRASEANIRDNLQRPYAVPRYLAIDLAWGRAWGPHEAQLRIDNLLGADDAEPGFGGIDLPARGRHGWVSYAYDL